MQAVMVTCRVIHTQKLSFTAHTIADRTTHVKLIAYPTLLRLSPLTFNVTNLLVNFLHRAYAFYLG